MGITNNKPLKKKKKGPGRPKVRVRVSNRAAASRTAEGDEKYIIIARIEDIEAMRGIARREGKTIKQVFAEAIRARVSLHEAEYGKIFL